MIFADCAASWRLDIWLLESLGCVLVVNIPNTQIVRVIPLGWNDLIIWCWWMALNRFFQLIQKVKHDRSCLILFNCTMLRLSASNWNFESSIVGILDIVGVWRYYGISVHPLRKQPGSHASIADLQLGCLAWQKLLGPTSYLVSWHPKIDLVHNPGFFRAIWELLIAGKFKVETLKKNCLLFDKLLYMILSNDLKIGSSWNGWFHVDESFHLSGRNGHKKHRFPDTAT